MVDNIIIIPYRDRKKHLDYYIKNTVPLLQKHLPNSKLVIIEQNHDKLFNRGKLLNCGFNEYKDRTNYFITQDVDLNPSEECIKKYYMSDVAENKVKGILTSPCNTLGGVIKISSNNIHKCNGFPNNIWGWGTEDKALQNRTEFYSIKKETNLITSDILGPNKYFKRFDDVNDRNLINTSKNHSLHYIQFNKLSREMKLNEILSSGLNSLNYKVIDKIKISDYIEHIKVEI